MSEWVMILTVTLAGQLGVMGDVQLEIVPGFSSNARCEDAANTIAKSVVFNVQDHRKAHNVSKKASLPYVNYKCVRIEK